MHLKSQSDDKKDPVSGMNCSWMLGAERWPMHAVLVFMLTTI